MSDEQQPALQVFAVATLASRGSAALASSRFVHSSAISARRSPSAAPARQWSNPCLKFHLNLQPLWMLCDVELKAKGFQHERNVLRMWS
jgi:hypothetical protein